MKSSRSKYWKRQQHWNGVIILLLKLHCCIIHAWFFGFADGLASSQIQALLDLKKLLETPTALANWNPQTDFCNLPSTSSLNVSCSSNSLIVLQIVGDKASLSVEQKFNTNYTEANVRLPDGFSSDALFNALLKFTNLRVLSLVSLGIWGLLPGKLDHLSSLQVLNFSCNFFSASVPQRLASLGSLEILALDNNILSGPFPDWLNILPNLDTLYLASNRFEGPLPSSISLFQNLKSLTLDHNLLTGQLPTSILRLQHLQLLSLSENMFSGNIPNLGSLRNLLHLSLKGNGFGPDFPTLGTQLISVDMQRNKLEGSIPQFLESFSSLRSLDLSLNSFTGTPPSGLFSLPSISFLVLSGNHLSGTLPYNLSLGTALVLLDISSNFFSGPLPRSLMLPLSTRLVKFQKNCFFSKLQHQQPRPYCQGVPRLMAAHSSHQVGLIIGIAIGVVVIITAGMITLGFICKFDQRKRGSSLLAEYKTSGVQPELLPHPRYLSPVTKMGMIDRSQNKVFSFQQLKEMTHNFSQNVLGEGQQGQVFKGWLEDGTSVAIKSMAIDSIQDVTELQAHMELLLKIRHRNLVSLLGYCLEQENDQHNRWRFFLVSEFVDSGTLHSELTKTEVKENLNWLQRLRIVMGAGKGILHLHSGIIPGIFNNDVNTTNILLDQNLLAKVCNFGLARHWQDSQGSDGKLATPKSPSTYVDVNSQQRKLGLAEMDVYNFGHVLLEIVLGKPATIENPYAAKPKIRELDLLITDHVPRWEVIDPAVVGTCMVESLATVLEIAAKCLSEDISARPSMEDVVWNLQYAAQVQESVSRELSPPRTSN